MRRFHGIRISAGGVYYVLKRRRLNRLSDEAAGKRPPRWRRYEKQTPGHHVQVDVKFLSFTDPEGRKVRRFQYTALEDATRLRVLKIYDRHTQLNAINFIDHVAEKLPFRIHTIRTDPGHEFQSAFHWHVGDLGMEHAYIKPRTPRLNGKVERSHRTDEQEFYQLITFIDDSDLARKLEAWQDFYNFFRPHGSLGGKSPYEAMREKLQRE